MFRSRFARCSKCLRCILLYRREFFIAHVRQTYSGTVPALPDASYMLVVAFAVSDADICPVAWADTVVQGGTQECVV